MTCTDTVRFTDIGTNEVFTLTFYEWRRRCADQYIKRGGLDEADAMMAAEVCLDLVTSDPDGYEYDSPEDMANDDMDCWTDDE